MFCDSFDACRLRVAQAVDRAFPSDDSNQTVEVDVIGLSMGGLVGRYCAAEFVPAGETPSSQPSPGGRGSKSGKRLRIRRLFTTSSPHLGAVRAERLPQLLELQRDMTPGSELYERLERAEASAGASGTRYELVPYVRLGDDVVGSANAAPKGRTAWWVTNPPGQFAHVGAMTDPRILADVVRRLRGEKPITKEPAAPLPPKF